MFLLNADAQSHDHNSLVTGRHIHGALEGALRPYENLNGLAAVGRQ